MDDKLKEIIIKVGMEDYELNADDIAQIKQVFADEYLRPEDLGLMTGAEFYKRFEKELDKEPTEMTGATELSDYSVEAVLRAAKKAAGL